MKPRTADTTDKVTSVRLPPRLRAALQAEAEAKGVTLTDVITINLAADLRLYGLTIAREFE